MLCTACLASSHTTFRAEFGQVIGFKQIYNLSMMLDFTEIVDFCDFLSPTSEEEAARNTAVEGVFDVIKHIWPHSKVCLMCFLSFSLTQHTTLQKHETY